jgi:hypothetical protein
MINFKLIHNIKRTSSSPLEDDLRRKRYNLRRYMPFFPHSDTPYFLPSRPRIKKKPYWSVKRV